MPFENKLSCNEQGYMWLEINAKHSYHESRPKDQGLYTNKGQLVYGFFCN